MSQAIIMIYINIANFALIAYLGKDHSMIETHHLKNVVVTFLQIPFISFSVKNFAPHFFI